jgi:KaiC/GvpD/RAD55 family RecA-like ATPase
MSKALPCITERLSKVVPLYGKELVLIGAETGAGKSSAAANIVVPIIEKGKRVLYVSTEEKAEDILTRIVSIRNGWNFATERNWSATQRAERDAKLKEIVEEDKIVVIDTYTPGKDRNYGYRVMPPDMTTLEGLKTALESVEKDDETFDLVIIDYISKVGTSNRFTNMQEWQVIWNATKYIEEWSKRIGVPTVVFTQLKPNESEDKEKPFKLRLPGSSRIPLLVTCAIEIKTNYQAKSSIWICHKARKGTLFRKTLKFDKGKFIDNPTELDSVEEIND